MPSAKEVLFDLGYRECIAASDLFFDNDPTTPQFIFGTLDKTKPVPACFNWPEHTKGPLVGPEGVSAEGAELAIEAGALGGELKRLLGPGYKVTSEDLDVFMNVKSRSGGAKPTIWNNDLRPLASPVVSPSDPPPVPPAQPPPVHPPVTPSPPAPDPVDKKRLAALEAFALRVHAILDKALAVPLAKDDDSEAACGLRAMRRKTRDAIKALNA